MENNMLHQNMKSNSIYLQPDAGRNLAERKQASNRTYDSGNVRNRKKFDQGGTQYPAWYGNDRTRTGIGKLYIKNAGESIRQMLMMMLALGSITKSEVCEFRCTMEKSVCSMLIEKGIPLSVRCFWRIIWQGWSKQMVPNWLAWIRNFMNC